MMRTSQLLGRTQAYNSTEALEAAIEADLNGAHVAQSDWTLHRAILLRAVRDLNVFRDVHA